MNWCVLKYWYICGWIEYSMKCLSKWSILSHLKFILSFSSLTCEYKAQIVETENIPVTLFANDFTLIENKSHYKLIINSTISKLQHTSHSQIDLRL